MLLRVEVAAFHSGLNRLVSVALSSSHDAWVLPSTLLCGARTFLWRCRMPATVWPTSRAILAYSGRSSLISGTGRRKKDQTVCSKEVDMRRRLYFLLPDLGSAIQTANDLLLARVEDSAMHFLARRGMSLGQLREASYLQ